MSAKDGHEDASTGREGSSAAQGVIISEAHVVAARAERAATLAASSAGSTAVNQLDDIWKRDMHPIDLPHYAKVHDTTLIFPEKLMMMIMHVEKHFSQSGRSTEKAPIAWALDGRAFVIRGDREEFARNWLPHFFPKGKFQSFTRKVYRWEFRQVILVWEMPQQDRKKRNIVFANPFFQRDRKGLMAHMRSVTVEGDRRRQQRVARGGDMSPSTEGIHLSPDPSRTLESTGLNQQSQMQLLQLASFMQPLPPALPAPPVVPLPPALPNPTVAVQTQLLAALELMNRQAAYRQYQNGLIQNALFGVAPAPRPLLPPLPPQLQPLLLASSMLGFPRATQPFIPPRETDDPDKESHTDAPPP
jgi:hypothetical protein